MGGSVASFWQPPRSWIRVPRHLQLPGKIYLNANQVPAAIQEYRRALAIDPTLEDARHDLAIAEGRLRAGH